MRNMANRKNVFTEAYFIVANTEKIIPIGDSNVTTTEMPPRSIDSTSAILEVLTTIETCNKENQNPATPEISFLPKASTSTVLEDFTTFTNHNDVVPKITETENSSTPNRNSHNKNNTSISDQPGP